ncbi:MAG: hypothetical protein SangKO_100250 [Sandaracinaceae bacterium]
MVDAERAGVEGFGIERAELHLGALGCEGAPEARLASDLACQDFRFRDARPGRSMDISGVDVAAMGDARNGEGRVCHRDRGLPRCGGSAADVKAPEAEPLARWTRAPEGRSHGLARPTLCRLGAE